MWLQLKKLWDERWDRTGRGLRGISTAGITLIYISLVITVADALWKSAAVVGFDYTFSWKGLFFVAGILMVAASAVFAGWVITVKLYLKFYDRAAMKAGEKNGRSGSRRLPSEAPP